MKRELTLIPKIKIHPTKIITYNEIHWSPAPPTRNSNDDCKTTLIQVEVNGKIELKRVSKSFLNSSRSGNGVLSIQARKRLKLAIEYFLIINQPNNGKSGNTGRHYDNKITFITLTLPSKQIHSDNEIKSKCLNQFLIEMAKYHKVTNYIWRAEYQKNGNIHFHILANRYIYWNDIRNRWNRIVNKLGYVDRYRIELNEYHKNGFQVREDLLTTWPKDKQYQAYLKGLKTDWHNPNSIDIHSIKNITNIQAYLTKYLTKNEQEKKTDNLKTELLKPEIGRTWGASVIISNIKGATTEIDSEIEEHLKKLEEHFNSHIFKSDYFTVIDISLDMIESIGCKSLTEIFYRYLFDEFNYSRQLTI
jgi:hypothetical protein